MSLTPFASWALITIVVGMPTFAVWCCLQVAGRWSEAEEGVTADELATALGRNRYPSKTQVRTVCRCCHQQIDRHYIDFRPDLGAVHIVDGLHIACRMGPEILIDFDHYPTADDLARHLRAIEGVREVA